MTTFVEFNKNYCVANYFTIYRNGINKNEKIISPYKYRELAKTTFLFNTEIDYENNNKRFAEYINNSNSKFVEISDCWVCFDSNMRIILYFGKDKPQRFRKVFKTKSKTYNKWVPILDQILFEKEHVALGWDVKESDKLFILNHGKFYELFPEILDTVGYCPQPKTLYNIEPFKMSDSYDYSDDVNKELYNKEIDEKKKQREYEKLIECRKHTPGYCSICGEPNAVYVDNPYDLEMNGCHNKEWLCSDCYNNLLGDI